MSSQKIKFGDKEVDQKNSIQNIFVRFCRFK